MRALALCVVFLAGCAPPPAVIAPATASPVSAGATPTSRASPAPTPSPTPTPVPKPPILSDAPVQSGLTVPWDLAFAPDGRMFVTERPGNVLIFENGAPNARRIGHFSLPNVRAVGESGLMGIAFDPEFASNGSIYVCASRIDEGEWRNQVLRLKVTGNEIAFDGYVIRAGMRAAVAHDGCTLRFGPDKKLWVSMGESTLARLAQDQSSLNGKILRVNTDGSIPTDNPVLSGRNERSAIYTFGHRNPQGLAFQPGSGVPVEVEHGEDTHDEINVLVPGANYGWPIVEGPNAPNRCNAAGVCFADPVWSSGKVTIANSGATFVTGAMWGTWSGSLFTAQLKEADLRRYVFEGTKVTPAEILLNGRYGRLRSPVQGPDGALYITTSNGSGDRIVRVVATQPPG
jgi:glucose/arabinose dehydrogenase